MRRLILSLAAGAAMAMGSTAANAAITLISCDGSLDNCTVNNAAAPAQSTLAWDDSSVTSPTFSATIDFSNNLAGNYWVSLTTSTPDILFTALTITPITGSGSITYVGPPTASITLLPGSLGIGSYHLSFSGNSPNGGAESGNLLFRLAVPEPATWGMMLLGFAGIGFAMRRRPRPVLAQIA
ncbi:MAG: FxDxF family PEP-CTERM protein [Sphingomicrobium sp.]